MRSADPMLHVPAVAIAPPMRCYARVENCAGPICGELAAWVRPGRDWFNPEYFCEQHRAPGDVAIGSEHVLRRVRINVDILIAGTSTNAPMAHVEAVARLELAVRKLGGVVDVNAVTSHVVKSSPPEPAGWRNEPSEHR